MSNDKLLEIGREMWEQSGGAVDTAAELFWACISNDQELFREIATPLVKLAIRATIESIMRAERPGFWKIQLAEEGLRICAKGETTAMAEVTRNGKIYQLNKNIAIYNYPLRNGNPLGDALRPELLAEVEKHDKQARTQKRNAIWFEMIFSSMPNDTDPVRMVFTESALLKLQERATERVDKLWREKKDGRKRPDLGGDATEDGMMM